MQRIQTALQHNRCVFILGEGLIGSTAEQEMVRKGFSGVSLEDTTSEHTTAFSAESLAPALQNQGIIVLIEPSFEEEHLEALSTLIGSQNPRPQLFIIAKFYNRFSMPMFMMNFKMNHIKHNALNFFRGLTVIEEQEIVSAPVKSARSGMSFEFIGRETEVTELTETLSNVGKPICIKGVEGIGKRTLIEHVIEAHEWIRIPDLHFTNYLNGDALLGRLAQVFAEVGNDALLKGLSGKKRISIEQTLKLLTEGLQLEGLSNYCFVISGINNRLNNRKQFHSVGLVEMVLEQIWNTETSLKLVFLSSQLPSSGKAMRTLSLGGFSTESSEAFLKMQQAPEYSESELEQILSRTKGHPLALRFLAVKTRGEGNYSLLSDERFAKMSSAQDFRQVRKMFQKLTNKLDTEESSALKTIAVFNSPVQAQHLTNLGINRKVRNALLSKGILEQTPSSKNRRYYAHELTYSVYRTEEIYNYDTMEILAEKQMDLSKDNSAKFNKSNPNSLFELAYLQEANSLFWAARKRKRVWRTPLPCVDVIVHTATILLSKKSNKKVDFGHIADLQIKDGFQQAPSHPELIFLEAKRLTQQKDKRKQLPTLFAEKRSKAPMPKFILEEAKVLIDLRQHDKAVQTLQEGVNLFGHLEELWFKLATVLSDQGHQAAALQTTDKAIELHPTSPAYHSLRGQILIKMGPDNWDNASVSLQQATTLYSGNSPVIHTLRQVDLLRSRSMLDVDQRGALLEEAQEFLKSALKSDSGHNKLQVAMASILLDLENEDYEQIESLIKDALKRRDNGDAHICKARLLIRQDNLIDVESHLDRAYKISRNNTAVNTVRGEYYLITGNPVLALKAFQSALDATSKGSPEFEQSKRHVEQVTAILAAQANVNYAEIGEDSINVVPLADENAEKRSPIVRRRSKTENTED